MNFVAIFKLPRKQEKGKKKKGKILRNRKKAGSGNELRKSVVLFVINIRPENDHRESKQKITGYPH